MSKDWKCPFCGSPKLKIPTGFVKPVGYQGETEEEMRFCCKAQAANDKFIDKAYHPDDAPSVDAVSKW